MTHRLYQSMIVDVERRNLLHWINLTEFIGMLFSATFHQTNRLYIVWYLFQVQRY